MPRRRINPRIAGIDPSLRASGVMVATAPFFRAGEFQWELVTRGTFGMALPADADDNQRAERLMKVTASVVGMVLKMKATHAVIGGHAFSRQESMVLERAELAGCIKRDLRAYGVHLLTVPDTEARKLLLGMNPAIDAKSFAHECLRKAGAPDGWTGDELDAFTFFNWGLAELGHVALSLGAG